MQPLAPHFWVPQFIFDFSLRADSRMCRLSAPLATPLPFYDRAKDAIMCYSTPSFGDFAWELPAYVVRARARGSRACQGCAFVVREAEGAGGWGCGGPAVFGGVHRVPSVVWVCALWDAR